MVLGYQQSRSGELKTDCVCIKMPCPLGNWFLVFCCPLVDTTNDHLLPLMGWKLNWMAAGLHFIFCKCGTLSKMLRLIIITCEQVLIIGSQCTLGMFEFHLDCCNALFWVSSKLSLRQAVECGWYHKGVLWIPWGSRYVLAELPIARGAEKVSPQVPPNVVFGFDCFSP